MNVKASRLIFWLVATGLLAVGLYYTFKEQPYYVDLGSVSRGSLEVSISEEGETRVRDIYEVSSPLMGKVLRIDVEAGDSVISAETIVAQIEPTDPNFLDLRSEQEAKAAVKTAEAELSLAKAQLKEAESEREFAYTELERTQRLIKRKLVSQRDLDQALTNYKTKTAAVNTAVASIRARQSELAQSKAKLVTPLQSRHSGEDCQCLSIYAPITGKVLRVIRESESVVNAGESLIEIGDINDLEIVVDFLSIDAVNIKPGQRVVIEDWGGESDLNGIVKKVEPFGYTKVSSLGIEEQRVDVIIDIIDDNKHWNALGHGYQVETRVILWHEEDLLKLPITALFRDNEDWSVFIVENQRATLKKVDIGRRNSFEAEILSGVTEDQRVILHPSNKVNEGLLIAKREL